MRLTKREQVLLIGALIIAIGAIFLNYIYFPLEKEIRDLEQKSTNLTMQLEDTKQKQRLLELLVDERAELQYVMSTEHQNVLRSWDEPKILIFMEEITENLSRNQAITFSGVTDMEWYQTGEIVVNYDVTYENLMAILRRLEGERYFNTISELQISKSNIDDNELAVNMRLNFYSHHQDWLNTAEEQWIGGYFQKSNIFE